MNRLRNWLHIVLMLALVPVVVSTGVARAEVDIYTTPGTHHVNGREWHTTCEPYSRTKRCRTKIKATQISSRGGRFVQSTGWVFNNLTYAASSRSLWNSNPLGGNGVVEGEVAWTAADGRKWRTECDTALTGRHGCRSFIEASIIEDYRTSNGATAYRWSTKWIFNNLVRFVPGSGTAPITHPSAPPMKSAPAFLRDRRHFTLGALITQGNAGPDSRGIGRLSNIELDPSGQLGTFRESYWSYTFDMAVEKDYAQFRSSIPNLPNGCTSSSNERAARTLLKLPALPSGVCDVRTARSFLGKPTVRSGTYEAVSSAGRNSIRLYWRNSPTVETYVDVTPGNQAYSEMRLTRQNHPGAVNAIGFMFGSTTQSGAGRSLAPMISQQQEWQPPRSVDKAQVSQSIFPFDAGGADKTLWTQTVGGPSVLASRQTFRFRDYVATSGGCIVTPPAVRGRAESGWHSYMCPLASDGRMVWHHMVSSLVAEAHGLCPAYVPGASAEEHWKRCRAASPATVNYSIPARPGGHVYEALQIVDDNNDLVGMVGLESSLYSHKKSSQSQLGLFAALSTGS